MPVEVRERVPGFQDIEGQGACRISGDTAVVVSRTGWAGRALGQNRSLEIEDARRPRWNVWDKGVCG